MRGQQVNRDLQEIRVLLALPVQAPRVQPETQVLPDQQGREPRALQGM